MKRRLLAAPAFACLFLIVAVSVHAQTETHNVRRLNLATKDLIYDAGTGKIYASVPSSAGAIGNSVTAIDPASGGIGASVYLGSEPGKLARSDNGQYLYVALDGAAAVRRYDIAAQSAGLEFSLGIDNYSGPYFAHDLAVLPGSPESVAVSHRGSSLGLGTIGVAIYDNGARREKVSSNFVSSAWIEFSASSSLLYAVNPNSSSVGRMTIDASGVSSSTSVQSTAFGDFRFDNGRIYTVSGRVIDPESGALLGSFTGLPPNASNQLVVSDSTAGRVYFLTAGSDQSQVILRAYDINSFLPTGSVTVPGLVGTPQSLIRWGANGLAFNTTGGQVYLIQTTLVPSNEAVPAPTPLPTPIITPPPPPPPATRREIALASNDIVYDAPSGKVYASVPSSAGAIGNSVTAIDPVSGAVGSSVYVGSEPGRLARSDNGQYLYVALNGAAAVRRYDIPTQSAGLQFNVGSTSNSGLLAVDDIKVVPDSTDSVAISRRIISGSPRHAGVAIYDNGVQRPVGTPDHSGSNVIEFSKSPGVLYGLNTESTEFGFRTMAVEACGVVVHNLRRSFSANFSASFKIDNERAYSSSGQVVDPVTGRQFGTFIFPEQNNQSNTTAAMLSDSVSGRIYFLRSVFVAAGSNATYTAVLHAFDQNTFLPLGALSVPGLRGPATSLIKVGADEVAFRTGGGQIMLVKTTDFAAASTAPLPAAPPPAKPTFGIYGRVATYDSKPIAGVRISVTGAQNAEALTDANGDYKIEGLSGCGSYTVTAAKTFYALSPPSTFNFTTSQNFNVSGRRGFDFRGSPYYVHPDAEIYTVAENAGNLRVRVIRDGAPSSTPVAFSYATADASPLVDCATVTGNASARCDYTASSGGATINGDATSRDVFIPIINDTHQEGPETFTVRISDPTNASLVAPSTITVTIIDDDAAPATTNPIDDAGFFVRAQYLDFLSREPEPDGYNAWVDTLAKCPNVNADPNCDRVRVSAGFFDSEEFKVKGFFVYKYYRASLGRRPTFAEVIPDMLLVTGQTAEERIAKQDSFAQSWLNRTAVSAMYPIGLSNADFVNKLEQTSGVTLANKAQLIADLNRLATNKSRVLRGIIESKEATDKYYNEAFVAMQYFGYLRRDPETKGFDDWLRTINVNPADVRRMVEGFLNSTEYRLRFGKE